MRTDGRQQLSGHRHFLDDLGSQPSYRLQRSWPGPAPICQAAGTGRQHTECRLRVHSFPPIASEMSRVLILGTMPGGVSLRERQYYAHPRNAFWRIVGEILGFDPASPYEARVEAMRSAAIALWDVVKSCIRPGSMDTAIQAYSVVPNDFAGFLAEHPQIERICFNGARAEALFMRHVRPRLSARPELRYLRLPSTSPAYAALPFRAKLRVWQAIVP
ncbi:MAG TPA: DNA-deoxyinosine glycosylase [Geminicoccaceae bacterium]|nr:DNA-deoxyinosine glycosylase [Geminicoccaceae bacterium]